MPRATTAAWLVIPPRTVRIPWAAAMPSMSSGLVSRRTRITFSPRAAHALASSAVKTIRPQAAPGEAARPLPTTWAAFRAAASNCGCSRASSCLGSTRHDLLLVQIMPSSTRSHGDLQGGSRGTLAVTGLEHIELAVLNGELHILHIPVVIFQAACDRGELLVDLEAYSSSSLSILAWACGYRPPRPRPGR